MRVVRDGELTWYAFIDAIAEKALIAGGGHHGYRRGFAVRVYGVRVCALFFRELPKLARAGSCRSFRAAAESGQAGRRCAGTSCAARSRSGQSETRKKKAGHHQHTEPRRAAVPGKKKMSSFTMGECNVDARARMSRISSLHPSAVPSSSRRCVKSFIIISRPIRELPNHRAETDLPPPIIEPPHSQPRPIASQVPSR